MMNRKADDKPRVLVLPGPALYHRLFTDEVDTRLRSFADVTYNQSDTNWTSEQLAKEIGQYDALITCWGSPRVTPEVLAAAPNLRVIAHSAGSVKPVVDENVLRCGVKVSSASMAMAPAVAEFALILTFLGLRPIHIFNTRMQVDKVWDEQDAFGIGLEISSVRIGVVGAGMVGRLYIQKARALGATVLVHDPYLKDDAAAELGVEKRSLEDLFRVCPIVVVHAPTTPQTHHMIGAQQLALLGDGGYLVNTARSWVVDQDALLAELQTGRIRAALDVFDHEPLSSDHPYRKLPNVILTPHIAGATLQTRQHQGEYAVVDLENVFAGRPMQFEVTLEKYPILA